MSGVLVKCGEGYARVHTGDSGASTVQRLEQFAVFSCHLGFHFLQL